MTYAVLAAVLAVSLLMHSVWGPLQLVGATVGALIAFIFPALLILRAERAPQARAAAHCRNASAGRESQPQNCMPLKTAHPRPASACLESQAPPPPSPLKAMM